MERRDRRFGWMLSAPGLLLLGAVVLFPIVWAGLTSFFDYTLLMPGYDSFVGIGNYRMAAGQGEFLHSAWITLLFVVAVVAIQFVIGMVVALALNDARRGKSVYYLILLCPLLINPVVVGLMWRMILHPTLGIVNWLLGTVGIAPVNWLGAPDMAFWTVVLVDIWHQVSFMVVLLLAGLSALPTEPYEAARCDGATAFQRFWHITLPLMRPVIIVTLLIRMIFAIKTYDIIYIMTRGGPGVATDLISYFIYRRAFVSLDLGQACAMAVMLLVVIAGMTAMLWRAMRQVGE
ncbi:multiple sugar transport system permease protein [Palleronia aestuarii]|uniref:Multiple sugar transport system permease protein n=2 Tax=Palleronia aestuarii TaxID=568105 RepID=A0A2W7MYH4_9RHOB|nr:multiple sugar transport system permease protein [Palleronia aestuarii]